MHALITTFFIKTAYQKDCKSEKLVYSPFCGFVKKSV